MDITTLILLTGYYLSCVFKGKLSRTIFELMLHNWMDPPTNHIGGVIANIVCSRRYGINVWLYSLEINTLKIDEGINEGEHKLLLLYM